MRHYYGFHVTTAQVNKRHAITGICAYYDDDVNDIRRQCSNILGYEDAYQMYTCTLSLKMVEPALQEQDEIEHGFDRTSSIAEDKYVCICGQDDCDG